ncbi:hypothetical protein ACFLTH_12540 [Bacteroidota bacterium]
MEKGQISLQFNWIFILAVGIIILIFFLIVVKNQTKNADYELSGDILRNLDTVVKSSEHVEGTFKRIKIPDSVIVFECETETNISFYNIGNGIRKDIPYDIIFSQRELKGTELMSITKSWDVPFRIAMFQYLTTKKAQFLIVEDTGGLAQELFDLLPENISKKMIETNDIVEDNNYDYYKIIQFEESLLPSENIRAPADRVHTITISPALGLDSYGTVKFDETTTHSYLKLASLFGAIFAHDADIYECTMNKAFQRFETLINLTSSRMAELKTTETDGQCISLLTWGEEDLDNILSNIQNNGLSSADTIYISSNSLERGNHNLIRGKNCPLVY